MKKRTIIENITKEQEELRIKTLVEQFLIKLKNLNLESNDFMNYYKTIREEGSILCKYLNKESISKLYEAEKLYQNILSVQNNKKNLIEALNNIKLTSINPEIFIKSMEIVREEETNIEDKGVQLELILSKKELDRYISICNYNSYFDETKNSLEKSTLEQFSKITTTREFYNYLLNNRYLTVNDYVNLLELRNYLKEYYKTTNKELFIKINNIINKINRPALSLYYKFNLNQRTNRNEEVKGLIKYLKNYPEEIFSTDYINQCKIRKEQEKIQRELDEQRELLSQVSIPKKIFNEINDEKSIKELLNKLSKKERYRLLYLVLILEENYNLKRNSIKIKSKLFDIAKEELSLKKPIILFNKKKVESLNSKLQEIDPNYRNILGFNFEKIDPEMDINPLAKLIVDKNIGIIDNESFEKQQKSLEKKQIKIKKDNQILTKEKDEQIIIQPVVETPKEKPKFITRLQVMVFNIFKGKSIVKIGESKEKTSEINRMLDNNKALIKEVEDYDQGLKKEFDYIQEQKELIKNINN